MIFNNIAVIPNEKKDPFFTNTKNLANYLSEKADKSGENIRIYADIVHQEKFCGRNINKVNFVCENDLYKTCNLLIVLGGDGTILKIASKASVFNIPVIGVNLGRIGFMSDIEVDEINLLDGLFSGNYKIEERMMINVEIIKQNGKTAEYAGSALNDAVITNGALSRLIEIDLVCDNIKITHYRADGVIIATPTGSTAYSMSAGGPVIDPNIECFCVTPICPHSFINRPIIFSHDSILEVANRSMNSDVYLTVDGQINVKLDVNDTVRIKKSKFVTKLIAIKKHGFFDVIRAKISDN
ncbi:MAG: NAD(+)/NADH kinase [Oscillospiraceae bacterium]|nr:NAD(+)/NADH kinase [Oscillospiraceae bacterium]